MYGGREKLHILLQSEKTCIVSATDTSFLPLFTDNTFTNWFQLDSSTAMYSMG